MYPPGFFPQNQQNVEPVHKLLLEIKKLQTKTNITLGTPHHY